MHHIVVILTKPPVHSLVNADHIIALGENGHILHQGSFEELQNDTNYLQGLNINRHDAMEARTEGEPSATKHSEVSHFGAADNEAASTGRVLGELATYGYYIGSVPAWQSLLFGGVVVLYGASYKMTELLLSFWTATAHPDQTTNNFYLGLYAMLSGLALLTITGAAYFYLIVMVPLSSEVLHARLLKTVISAPLSFFSKTDVGVTTNRFSQDMSVIDTELPFALVDFVIDLCVLVMGAVLMCVFSGYFAALVPPVIFFCYREFAPFRRH